MIARRRNIFLVLLIIFAIGGASFIYLYYKPHRDVSVEKAVEVHADSLFAAYNSNEQDANRRYLDKALLVSGIIEEIIVNQQGQQVIVFKSADPIGAVTATLSMAPEKNPEPGTPVKVKGFCSGYSTDVVLRDCFVIYDPIKK